MALRPPGEERRLAPRRRGHERALLLVVDGDRLAMSEHELIDLSVQAIALRADEGPPPTTVVAVFLRQVGPLAVLGAVRPADPERPGVLVIDVLDRDGPTGGRLAMYVAAGGEGPD